MKKIILSIASLCMTGIAFGQQWTTSGNNIFNTNSGYVGLSARFLLQGTNTSSNNWSRGNIGQGVYWDNTNNWWQIGVPSDLNTDFSLMRFVNNSGALSFYTGASTGAAYHLTDAQLDGYRRLTVNNSGIEVNGGISFTPSTNYWRGIAGNSSNYGLSLASNGDASNGSAMLMYSNNASGIGRIDMIAGDGNGTPTSNDVAFNFMSYSTGLYKTYMSIFKNGGIVIGDVPSRPAGYKLYVETGILTEKIRVAVKSSANWADHVFADNYELKPLHEVEGYIKENKHLPEIPSANDVVKNGVDLGTMDAKLLQKIEELTLYVIQQQKQLEKQQNEIEILKKNK